MNTSTTRQAGSLVDLAAREQLPLHQYTDRATVRWIVANRPDLPDTPVPLLPSSSQELLRLAGVPTAWWLKEKVADSLHGVRHAMRTAAIAALLADRVGLPASETADLILAAAVHDCRRLHDKGDRGHGARAAAWLTENADTVWPHFGLSPTALLTDRAATAVRLHDVPYTAFSRDDLADHDRAAHLCDLLKAADALDRYRLPKVNWWPDGAQVRVAAFDRFRSTAFDLVVWSEQAHLDGLGSAEAVLHALRKRGLLS
jgi:hypothetical protein